jgi:3-methyladenine DNA glycosylase AlkD
MGASDNIVTIKAKLRAAVDPSKKSNAIFFKTGIGHYAEHDQFIGVSVPNLRLIAKQYSNLELKHLKQILTSPINEERLLALIILVNQYKSSNQDYKNAIYEFYINNLKYINNWNLVDASAHLIVGAHLNTKSKAYLLQLSQSNVLWERRIAIVATWYFIRNDNLKPTFKVAKKLMRDEHDLIHKAVGWMLREAGKRDQGQLVDFLDQYSSVMPRTMLRYAIERFPESVRKGYLTK